MMLVCKACAIGRILLRTIDGVQPSLKIAIKTLGVIFNPTFQFFFICTSFCVYILEIEFGENSVFALQIPPNLGRNSKHF